MSPSIPSRDERDVSERPGLKSRALQGTAWTLTGYGIQHGLRLASNLILTRLLFPEAFGLMALVNTLLTGMQMLSDVGLGPALIQNRRGDDPEYLHTAWTIKVVRGFGLTLIAGILAWPVSAFYGEDELLLLLPVAGVGLAVRGFASMRGVSLNRNLQLGRITLLETVVPVITTLVTVASAWWLKSVWALVIGRVAGDAVHALLSHLMLPGPRDRFGWNREATRELIRVGRWIFVSTAVTFAAQSLDKLILGKLLTVKELGVYIIGLFLLEAVMKAGHAVYSRVFFPMLSETAREKPDLLRPRLLKVRLYWVLPTVLALVLFAVLGQILVRFLYPPEFHNAGWILRILAAGRVVSALIQPSGAVWSALGAFRLLAALLAVKIPLLLGASIGGYFVGGLPGFVIGVALAEFSVYPLQAILLRREGLWHPGFDFAVALGSYGMIALGYLLV